MAFGLGRSTATVKLSADTAGFSRDLAKGQAAFRSTAKDLTDHQLKLEISQERYNRAVGKFGAESLQAKSALLGLRNAEASLDAETQRSTRHLGLFAHTLGKAERGALAGSGAFRHFGRSLAFASGSFLGAAGFTSVMRQSISAASDLHEQINKVDVVFRGNQRSVLEWSKTTAGSLGIARDQALAYAATFGNILVPMGLARDKASQMSTQLVKLSADMASFNNASPEDTLQAIQSALAGQARPLRQYGVFLDENRVKAEAMRMGLAKTAAELTNGDKVLARYAIILKDSKDAQGDFARTSGGLANQQRILHARLRDTEAQVGQALLPAVLKVTSAVNVWLSKSKNQEAIQRTLNSVIRIATSLVKALADIVKTIAPYFQGFAKAVGGTTNAFKLLFGLAIAAKLRAIALSLQLVGTSAATAGGKAGVGGLLSKLGLLRALGPIGVVISLAVIGNKYADKIFGKDLTGARSKDNFGNLISGKVQEATGSAGTSGQHRDAPSSLGIQTVAPKPKPKYNPPKNVLGDAGGGSSGGSGSAGLASSKGGGAYQGSVHLAAGADRGGVHTKPHVIEFVRRISSIVGKPLTITTGTNHNEFVAGTNRESDHWTGNAADIPATGASLTRLGQAALEAAGLSASAASRYHGGAYNIGDVNILFNTNIGGNHFNHVHVGLHSLPAGGRGQDGQTLSVAGKPKGPPPAAWNQVDAKGRVITGRGGGIGGAGGGAGIGGAAPAQSISDKLAGHDQQSVNIPGIGKVLVNVTTKPSKETVAKIIQELIVKIKAAKARLAKFQKALGKELRRKHRKASLIGHLRARIKATQIIIRDLLSDLGLAYDEFSILNAESADEAAAGEGDGGGGGGGNNNEKNNEAPFDPTASSQVPLELRSASAAASLTPGTDDDVAVLRQQEQLFAGRLAGSTNPEERIALTEALLSTRSALAGAVTNPGTAIQLQQAQARRTASTADDQALLQKIYDMAQARLKESRTIEEQIALTNQLADLEEQLKNTRASENAEMIAYLSNLRQLSRQYGSNLYVPQGGTSGITLNTYVTSAAGADPHILSNTIAFELQALVS